MRVVVAILIVFSFCIGFAKGQFEYEVVFKDKIQTDFSLASPNKFLSQRAIDRRFKQGIAIDSSDLPISAIYLSELKEVNSISILSKSKWFNDVIIGVLDTSILKKIRSLSFVKEINVLPGSFSKSGKKKESKLYVEEIQTEPVFNNEIYGAAYRQIAMLNADYLHKKGFKGEGILISVIDGGFSSMWFSPHFKHLFDNGQIIDAYDFISNDDSIYFHSIHGNRVMSTMAAYSPNKMIGTAPEASYILLRSEDGLGEYLLEEYFWTEAAEFADSAGSDIINSSLGYSLFDDTLQDHRYKDMDGISTRTALSATKAANKGMLVFNSAGNSGNSQWAKITSPGDAFDILTVGAVDSSGKVANFSSRGLSFDGRIKPEVMAMGARVFVGLDDGSVAASNGTSFSSPIMAGASACLWQSNPSKSWKEVREAIIKSTNSYNSPDSNIGYGIPDFYLADAILNGRPSTKKIGESSVLVYPNPFINELHITFRLEKRKSIDVEIIHSMGNVVKRLSYVGGGENTSIIYLQDEIADLAPSLYIIRISGEGISKEIKVIKE